ncbi:hypothetical protein I6A60_00465 [Frankia sp. AgB1.9]|uniref:hypothetical protein n=1 Tax=unclassified Frankia TaxID=2632575 RepID=UPI001932A1DE|nr:MULTISPECIES: hypothetical protein [unclassified Frankia]MBL7487353.1 hypothetical protein [Frankia sp. AgW1.1]MBL7546361.1 hypothetical protein [Frankia sp. AgB1.9]MBL7618594.1 hypothetical protein [Frankia sp. AgB1.8]
MTTQPDFSEHPDLMALGTATATVPVSVIFDAFQAAREHTLDYAHRATDLRESGDLRTCDLAAEVGCEGLNLAGDMIARVLFGADHPEPEPQLAYDDLNEALSTLISAAVAMSKAIPVRSAVKLLHAMAGHLTAQAESGADGTNLPDGMGNPLALFPHLGYHRHISTAALQGAFDKAAAVAVKHRTTTPLAAAAVRDVLDEIGTHLTDALVNGQVRCGGCGEHVRARTDGSPAKHRTEGGHVCPGYLP